MSVLGECSDSKTKINYKFIRNQRRLWLNPTEAIKDNYEWQQAFLIQRRARGIILQELSEISMEESCRYHDYARQNKRQCIHIVDLFRAFGWDDQEISIIFLNDPFMQYICWSCSQGVIRSNNPAAALKDLETKRAPGSLPISSTDFYKHTRYFDPRYGAEVKTCVQDPELKYISSEYSEASTSFMGTELTPLGSLIGENILKENYTKSHSASSLDTDS